MGEGMSKTEIYYFGVWSWSGAGHYMYLPNGHKAREGDLPKDMPWNSGDIDAKMQPGTTPDCSMYARREELEGHATLHRKNGWTALCFWDRSEDKRFGCSSNFIARGDFTFEQMVELAMQHFAPIWGRFKFEVKLVETRYDRSFPPEVAVAFFNPNGIKKLEITSTPGSPMHYDKDGNTPVQGVPRVVPGKEEDDG